uniref:Uncharacterized protein n=1 Tax=Haptolina brevifila TaxID=156173 RepID=A0A7S2HNC9_9EUKA|mmetsp:Transcript_56318/g.111821  ORF Transcript_56318/g.111821 Transcript_56318/m.111821 type:complete len:130 (+) Transcript_56318:2-391(+)
MFCLVLPSQVPLTSVLRIITSDLLQSGAAGPYVAVLNSLLEGRPLDAAMPGAQLTPSSSAAHASVFRAGHGRTPAPLAPGSMDPAAALPRDASASSHAHAHTHTHTSSVYDEEEVVSFGYEGGALSKQA